MADGEALEFIAYIQHGKPGSQLKETEFQCTGVVISLSHVLTAASCVKDLSPSELLIVVGSLDRFLLNNGSIHEVKKVSVHSNYTDKRLMNNIALIEVT